MKTKYISTVKKLIVLLHFTLFLQISLAGYAQRVTYQASNEPLSKALKAIPQQTDYEVLGNQTMFARTRPVTVKVRDMAVFEYLELLLEGQPLSYRVVDKTIMLETKEALPSAGAPLATTRQQPIQGLVLGQAGDQRLPLAGATIAAHGSQPIVADENGRFTLKEAPSDNQLLVSFIGYESQTVTLVSGKTEYTIVLTEETSTMDEVVVTGYQVINRDSYTGTAITKSGEELQQVNPQNVLQAMQTFDPSFRLAENNLLGSDPNALPNITVRGSSALPGGVDGDILRRDNVTSMVNMPAFILDGYEVSVQKVLDLDMNRIASVTLLKDAAATAIYGSRAANGVMVITTKVPKDGKLQLTYSHETSVSGPDLTDYNVLNAAEKLEYERLAGLYTANGGQSQYNLDVLYYAKKASVVGGVDTYWLSQPVRTAVGQKHGLFLEGGSPVFRYGVDLRYQTRPGVMKGSHRNQYSGAMNFSYDLNNKIRFQNELSVTMVGSQESPYGSFANYVRMNPYYRMTDDNGNVIQSPEQLAYADASGAVNYVNLLNPLYDATLSSFNRQNYSEITDNLAGEFELAPGLRLRGQLSFTKRLHQASNYRSPLANEFYNYEASRADEKGAYYSANINETYWDGNLRVNYIKQVGDHSINLVGGANIRTERLEERSFEAIGFPNDRFSSIGFAKGYAENASPSSQLNESRLFGVFASTNYSFRNRYLLDATIRLDGSSKFGSDNRTAPFWSAGLGWNVHQEPWFQSDVVSQLRLRLTTGVTGSVQFSPYMSRTTYRYQQDNWYSSGIGAIVQTFGNSNLSWQQTFTTDAGFDLGLFDDRLTVTPRVYRRLTRDILADITIAPSTGFASYKENLGDMENRGAELNLMAQAVKTRDWTVSFMANLAHNTNKIVRISNSLKAYNDRVNDAQENIPNEPGEPDYRGVPLLRYNEGQSIDAIYAVPSLGIDPENGKEIFVKRDGSLSYEWDARDITVVGDATPKMEGSFGTTVRYKQFTAVVYFQTRFGGDTYNQTLVDRVENADPRYNVDRRVLEKKWQVPGDRTFYKDIKDLGQTRVSSRFIMPDHTLSLQSVYLSYDLNQELADRLSLSRLRLGLTANDLFRWSSIEIERGIDYPFARTVTFSLQAAF